MFLEKYIEPLSFLVQGTEKDCREYALSSIVAGQFIRKRNVEFALTITLNNYELREKILLVKVVIELMGALVEVRSCFNHRHPER